jgi:hypothetical protein
MQIHVNQNFAGYDLSAYSGHVAAVRQSEPSIHVLGPLTQDDIVHIATVADEYPDLDRKLNIRPEFSKMVAGKLVHRPRGRC